MPVNQTIESRLHTYLIAIVLHFTSLCNVLKRKDVLARFCLYLLSRCLSHVKDLFQHRHRQLKGGPLVQCGLCNNRETSGQFRFYFRKILKYYFRYLQSSSTINIMFKLSYLLFFSVTHSILFLVD